ncbi:MAG: phosphotransferase [Spirochaetes bacterium]|jgi:aminoglycoside phosphotransferase (APT) family kinase protein|nr:phosphotransferase [Spirochaetota bacterium]
MNVQEELLRGRIDPHLTCENLSRLTGAAVQGYEILTGGCWNRVIGVRVDGTELVLKISPHENDANIIREFRVLEVFARVTELPVPTPLRLDAADGVLPGTALVMTRLPGRVMHEAFGYLDRRARRNIIDEIAEHVTALHQVRGRGFGGVELREDERMSSWPDFWLPRLDRVLDEAEKSGAVPQSLIDESRRFRPHLRPFLDIGEHSTMTHYDIWAGNVMIDIDSDPPRVSGYIDIPGHFADYARELSFAMLFGVADRRFLETYGTEHQFDEGFPLRVNIYNLRTNIKHIQMYPSQSIYREGAAENLQAIHRAVERT